MCYLLINKTSGSHTSWTGSWNSLTDELVKSKCQIIVISLYSNTIKVPRMEGDEVVWTDYNIPIDDLKYYLTTKQD